MSFQADLAEQEPFERKIADLVARKMGGLVQPKTPGIDLGKDFTLFVPFGIEVKCDKKSNVTGNLYFEVHNSKQDKPSGLRATKAAKIYHYAPSRKTMFIYAPGMMLLELTSKPYKFVTKVGDNNSDGYVVPITEVEKFNFVEIMIL
jgi:hypothetical protein